MIVEGKIWASGVYKIERVLHYGGERKVMDTRTIKITGKLVEEITEQKQNEGENARKIIFKSKSKEKLLMWKYNSKIGLLFEKTTEQ